MKGPQRGETNTAWGPSGCCPSYSRGNRHPSLPPGPPISIFLWPNPTGGQRPGGLVVAGHRDRQNRWRGSGGMRELTPIVAIAARPLTPSLLEGQVPGGAAEGTKVLANG